MSSESLAQIAVARPVQRLFTYRVPASMEGQLTVGQRVRVPFGKGQALGFYLGAGASNGTSHEPQKLKSLIEVLETRPALPADVMALATFAAEHYRYPLGEVLRAALPPGLTDAVLEETVAPEVEAFVSVKPDVEIAKLRRAPLQSAVVSYLLAVGGTAPIEEVSLAVPGARDALKRLVERGIVSREDRETVQTRPESMSQGRPAQLTPDQVVAVEALERALSLPSFQPFLLQGVTGSGKTEVYLRAVERVLERQGGALVLVPEIALTPQLVGRFASRFGNQVAVLHSGLKDRERTRQWQLLREGAVRVAVGVRSAVFAPVQALSLIVVDEEHDASFKQEEKLKYQARDLAVMRAKQLNAVVVLGSATPSLETLENARRGRYGHLHLHTRVSERPMPRIEMVDLRRERLAPPSVLSTSAIQAMRETLARGQQTILFLNRRGHSTFLLCSQCGTPVRCHQCDVTLTHHLSERRVMCHYCGESRPLPTACTECEGPLLHLGAGTERVEAEVAANFPEARLARLDRDAVSSAESLTQVLTTFARREIDILIGTQMVAKGHDFPGVTLVCVVLADTALSLPDFRAAERTFQLLTQVSGRAGRGSEPGRVLLQTYNPDAPCIQRVVQHDFEGFADEELGWRKALMYPPFARLAVLRVESAQESEASRTARGLADLLGRMLSGSAGHFASGEKTGVRLLGPAIAPLSRLRGKSRWQLLLKAPTYGAMSPLLEAVEQQARTLPTTVRVVVDVDPWTML
jgi:primosomal protein N' (replication factor Y)